ncbi:MAG: S41 family peptidase [Bacteroidaceae bacterium]|nr:S41 family peptidase [Bacteroidaceae bacterium]
MVKIFQNLFRKITLFVCLATSSAGLAQINLANKELRKLLLTETAIQSLYVDSMDESKLVESAVLGMIKQLDPHSAYTAAKDVQALTEPLKGGFEGIGVQYNMVEDTLVVIQPVANGPSEKVGIIAGDRIVFVNDTIIAGVKMTKEGIMKLLRGPKGSKVKLGIKRQGIKGINDFIVTRDKIPLYSIDAKYMIDNETGYVHINNFGATTHDEFANILLELKNKGMKNLIIDLQGNGGGYLEAAVNISNELLENNDLIVYTEGRVTKRKEYHSNGLGYFKEGKVVVLIDSYSASASEILAGAVQDNDRGIVVGRRSFGKGLVQRQIDLPDGSLIRLTTAHYYSPSGRCIQKPYKLGNRKDYDSDLEERLKSGELTNVDSIHFPDSLKFTTLKKHRTVYGGGGIMPDIYVPLDTNTYTSFHREIAAKSCIVNTTLKYIDQNRNHLKKTYKTFEAFNANFSVPQDMIDLLLENAQKAKIEYNDSILQKSLPLIKLQLKALLARDMWDMSEYYQIINTTNEIYLKALEALKDDKYESTFHI